MIRRPKNNNLDLPSSSLLSCSELINRHFQGLGENYTSEKELEEALTSIIHHLLDQDIARLMNIFYKIDLDENIFKSVIASENAEKMSQTLAKEVIKRELQKVKTREQYRSV